jgi:hypothetical protein
MNIKYSIKNYLNLSTHTAFGMSLPVWLKLLFKNKFDIDIRFLPKVIFITSNIILNTPFQFYEFLRYNKKINKTKVQRPLFIVGHPRSGTTYLQYVLSKDPNFSFCSTYEALVPHTFLSIGNFTKKILSLAMPETRPQDNVKAGADKPKEEEFAMGNMCSTSLVHGYYFPKSMHSVFDEVVTFEKGSPKLLNIWKKQLDFFIKKISYKYPGKRILLKSPANTGRIKEILELYPDACFIHIHRDPYAVYQSNEKLYEKILPILGFQKVNDEFIKNFILYSYKKMYEKFLLDKLSIPEGQFIEMSYHDFVTSPIDQLEKAYAHLNLGDFEKARPHLMEEIKSVEDYQKNTYINLKEDTKKRIDEEWSFLFDTYGYSKTN